MKCKACLLTFLPLILFHVAAAQTRVLLKGMHHLRNGDSREWNNFPVHAKNNKLTLRFEIADSAVSSTIRLRQYDIKHDWNLYINDKQLGSLVVDEKDMISYFAVPHSALTTNNELRIEAQTGSAVSDDIKVGELWFINKPIDDVLSEASVDVSVTDENNKAVPSRITIVNSNGALQQIKADPSQNIAIRTGVIYSGNGTSAFELPAGNYMMYVTRGFEYGVDSVQLKVAAGAKLQHHLTVRKEVNVDGWISCDPHIHTFTFSGHGDANVHERVLTIAGEGLELPVMTDHNVAIDITDTVKKMGLTKWMTAITGNEVTTDVGHFNIMPVSANEPVPDHQVKTWDALAENIGKHSQPKVIILNHARDIHRGFRPFDTTHHIAIAGKSYHGWKLPANAMEIMNSGSQQTDPRQLYHDWMGMLNRGILLAPVGSSDSHDVYRFVVGQARTYIRASNADSALDRFTEGRVIMSFGLFTEMTINDAFGPGQIAAVPDNINVSAKVSGPSWTEANKFVLYSNGIKIRETRIKKTKKGGVKWRQDFNLPKPAHDIFLVAVAEGPGIDVPFWPIAKPFQPVSTQPSPLLLSVTNAIRIDADGDGKFTSAYEYARHVWDSCNNDVNMYLEKIAAFDEAVAVQAAAVLSENEIDVTTPQIITAIAKADAKIQRAFLQFAKQYKQIRREP